MDHYIWSELHQIYGGHVSSVDSGGIQTKNNGPF